MKIEMKTRPQSYCARWHEERYCRLTASNFGVVIKLFAKFKEISLWPNRQTIDKYMPASFRALYLTTRCIIDATEIFIQMPSNPTAQQLTFSSYKNLKALVGITPSGAICFVSNLYGGNISDKK